MLSTAREICLTIVRLCCRQSVAAGRVQDALRQQVLVPELRAAAGARRRQVIPADVRGSRKRPTHADYPLVPGARATPTIRWYLGGRPITAGKYFYIIVRTERD